MLPSVHIDIAAESKMAAKTFFQFKIAQMAIFEKNLFDVYLE
jgi:hypothetical protein